jgi:hypothetical protein
MTQLYLQRFKYPAATKSGFDQAWGRCPPDLRENRQLGWC